MRIKASGLLGDVLYTQFISLSTEPWTRPNNGSFSALHRSGGHSGEKVALRN